MQPCTQPLCYHSRTRPDRLSITVIPEQSRDAEPQSPDLHWLFGKSNEIDHHSRLMSDEFADAVGEGVSPSKADAVIMKEVAAWLELREHDEFAVSDRRHVGREVS